MYKFFKKYQLKLFVFIIKLKIKFNKICNIILYE